VKIIARCLFLTLAAWSVAGCTNETSSTGLLGSALQQGAVLHWSIPIPVEGGLASKIHLPDTQSRPL
jgi:hypothetical protein